MDKKLIKEFPFLEGLEKEFGELGHVRVQRGSREELEMVRDLPTQQGNVKHCVKEIPSSNKDEGFLFHRAELKLPKPLRPLVTTMIYKFKKEDNKMSNTINLFGNEIELREVSTNIKGSKVILGHLVYGLGIIHPDCPDSFIPYPGLQKFGNTSVYTILDKIQRDEFALFIDVEVYEDTPSRGYSEDFRITIYPGGEPKITLNGEENPQKEYFVYEIERDENNNVTSLKPLKQFNESLTTNNGFYIPSEAIGLVNGIDEAGELPQYVKYDEDNADLFIMAFEEPLANETVLSYAKGKLKLDLVS